MYKPRPHLPPLPAHQRPWSERQRMIAQLRLRLSYAQLKVEHNWASERIDQVENLFDHMQRKRKVGELDPELVTADKGKESASATGMARPAKRPRSNKQEGGGGGVGAGGPANGATSAATSQQAVVAPLSSTILPAAELAAGLSEPSGFAKTNGKGKSRAKSQAQASVATNTQAQPGDISVRPPSATLPTSAALPSSSDTRTPPQSYHALPPNAGRPPSGANNGPGFPIASTSGSATGSAGHHSMPGSGGIYTSPSRQSYNSHYTAASHSISPTASRTPHKQMGLGAGPGMPPGSGNASSRAAAIASLTTSAPRTYADFWKSSSTSGILTSGASAPAAAAPIMGFSSGNEAFGGDETITNTNFDMSMTDFDRMQFGPPQSMP